MPNLSISIEPPYKKKPRINKPSKTVPSPNWFTRKQSTLNTNRE